MRWGIQPFLKLLDSNLHHFGKHDQQFEIIRVELQQHQIKLILNK